MQIGKFAALCGTKISVLRHYDREGLIVPEYIDKFTGYRYYSAEQKDVFMRITLLKSARFSLSEIRDILTHTHSDDEIMSLVRKKKDELCRQLEMLNEVMKTMTDTQRKIKVYFKNTDAGDAAFTERADGNDFPALCRAIEEELDEKHYQRTSTYRSYGEPMSNEVYAECDVVKLTADTTMPHDDIAPPFVNDDIVGKWEIVGEYDVADDFYAGRRREDSSGSEKGVRFIYFLPNGERYWCYGWTRGKILFQNGWCSSAEDYHTAEYAGERYMFVAHKSYFFMHGGKPTTLVLRQLDTKSYTKAEIARRDNVDMMFVDDDAVIGSWHAVGYCRTKESFDPDEKIIPKLFFKCVEFRPGGSLAADYGERHAEDDFQRWTRGFILRRDNNTACAYEIRGERLFIEWKSGDYIYGGMEPKYYVFERE